MNKQIYMNLMEIKKVRNKIDLIRKKVEEMNLKKLLIRKNKISFWKEREKGQIMLLKKMKEEIIWLI